MENLEFELPIGIPVGNDVLTNVTLSRIDGIAEKVILNKIQTKPYTWQANVLAVAIDEIDGVDVSKDAKASYLKDGRVHIPDIIKKMTLADVTTCMTEIHRRVWQSEFEDYPYACSVCGHKSTKTLDLYKCKLPEQFVEEVASGESRSKYSTLTYILKNPFAFVGMKNAKGESVDQLAEGKPVVKFDFVPPNLLHAINNEKLLGPTTSEQVDFWRSLSIDCLQSAYAALDQEGNDLHKVSNFKQTYKSELFNKTLHRQDLAGIRKLVRENMPIIPFMYIDHCDNCGSEVPMVVEPNDFFGE